jgi:hypothetical protein
MSRYALVPLLIFTFLFNSCTRDEASPELKRTVLATVDEIEISETSFQRAYLPVLLYGDKFDSEENRSDMINFLIGQKILAQKGRASHLDTSNHIVRMKKQIENRALSRQLYKKWVKDQLELPTEADLRKGFVRGQKGLFVRHLFAKTEEEIRDYSRRLASGDESFYSLAQEVFTDTLLSKNGGALGWMTFGDLDETLEDTLYSLKAGQISQPVKSQYGWHILSVDDTQEEVFVTEEDFQKNRHLIYNKILERRENLLGKQVLNDFMANFNIEFNREITRQVWPEVIAHLNPEGAHTGPPLEVSGLNNSLDNLRDETLLTVDGESWSVAEILKRLPELDRSLLYGNLYIAASNIIRNEMIAREARDLGLQNHPDVLEEVQDSQDQIIADTYVGLISDTLTFTHDHVWNYYQQHKLTKYHAPDSLKIEVFGFSDSTIAIKALYRLRNATLATDSADQTFWITAGGETNPLFLLSRSIATGTMAGPVRYNQQWCLVKLLDRKRFPLPFEAIQNRIKEDMERERFASTRGILLNEFRPEHKISIDYQLLNK